MKKISMVVGALLLAGAASQVSAATYSTQASFLSANPGTTLTSFTGLAPSTLDNVSEPYTVGALTFNGLDLYTVSTAFWGSVDSLLDNRFNGFINVTLPSSNAVGFYFASSYSGGTSIDFTAWNGVTQVASQTLTGGGTLDSFAYFGIDGVGPITSFTLNSAPYSSGFASIGEISNGAVVPEPASWALMIVGFGLVGFAMRRRAFATA